MHRENPKFCDLLPCPAGLSKRPTQAERAMHRDKPKRSGVAERTPEQERRSPGVAGRRYWRLPKRRGVKRRRHRENPKECEQKQPASHREQRRAIRNTRRRIDNAHRFGDYRCDGRNIRRQGSANSRRYP